MKKLLIPTCPGCCKPMSLQYEYSDGNLIRTIRVSGWDRSQYQGINEEQVVSYRFVCECGWESPVKTLYTDAYSAVTDLGIISDIERELKKFKSKFYAVRKAWVNLQRRMSYDG